MGGKWSTDLMCPQLKTHVYQENNSSQLMLLFKAALCLKDPFYDDEYRKTNNMTIIERPIFHISKEVVRPYYIGWIIKKKSLWRSRVNAHILKYQQV